MIVNNLLGLEKTLEYQKQGIHPEIWKDRHTGRSTRMALEYISIAMYQENNWVRIKDHHPGLNFEMILLNTIMEIVLKLEFRCFEFKSSPASIKFKIFEEFEKKTVWVKKE